MHSPTTHPRLNAAGAPMPATHSLAGKYMTFRLASEIYGLEILTVRDVIRLVPITRVPRTREDIRGVINVRGSVIPVVDLRLKFGLPATELTAQTVIIVLQVEDRETAMNMGILVEEVLEVLDIAGEEIEPTPQFGGGSVDPDFFLGIGKDHDRIIFLLDIGHILTSTEWKGTAEQDGA